VTGKTIDSDERQKAELKNKENFDNMATYAQMQWIPNSDFYLVTGFRYVDSKKQYPSELIPRLGMSYVLNPQWMAKFNYQKGYRPPAVSDGKQRGITVAENSDLTSETIDSYELSLVGNPHPQLGVRATYFQSKISDLIALTAYNGTGNYTSITDNVGQIDVNGIEFELNYEVNDKLKIESTAIYTDSVNDETNEKVRTVVPYKLNLSFIARPIENWELVWDNYFRWNPTTDEENTLYKGEDAKDWVLSNLTVTNKRSFNVKGLNLMLSVRNLFNQSYGHVDPRSTLAKKPFLTSYHPQEKINVMMGVNYRF
jgi:outer membrane receptor protein involved in Fe transport